MNTATDLQPAALPLSTYDPNTTAFTVNTVRLDLCQWDYHQHVRVAVRGNNLGFDVLEAALERFVEQYESQIDNGEPFVLERADGAVLAIDNYESTPARSLVVAATIINRKEN